MTARLALIRVLVNIVSYYNSYVFWILKYYFKTQNCLSVTHISKTLMLLLNKDLDGKQQKNAPVKPGHN